MPPTIVHVLEEDPSLGDALGADDFAVAAKHLVAAEIRVERGPWAADHPLGDSPGDLGFLVLDGLLLRQTHVGRHATGELLGTGDILRPWDHADDPGAPVEGGSGWQVLEPMRLAILDARFAVLCGRLPTVTAQLLSRAVRRSRLLAVLLAVSSMPRLDARLLALFWHLADRWGTVGREGTLVPLRLTHATLGQLVGAHRPSVTSALRGLEERGILRRLPDGSGWLLLGDPPGDPELALGAHAPGRDT